VIFLVAELIEIENKRYLALLLNLWQALSSALCGPDDSLVLFWGVIFWLRNLLKLKTKDILLCS
jgi:hypothetical protein